MQQRKKLDECHRDRRFKLRELDSFLSEYQSRVSSMTRDLAVAHRRFGDSDDRLIGLRGTFAAIHRD